MMDKLPIDELKEYIEIMCHGDELPPDHILHRAVAALEKSQRTEFHPDWSLLEAANDSLREHMAMVKSDRDAIRRFAEDEICLAELLEVTGLLVN